MANIAASTVEYAATGTASRGSWRRAASAMTGVVVSQSASATLTPFVGGAVSRCPRGASAATYATCAPKNEPSPARNARSPEPSSATSPPQDNACAAVMPAGAVG